MCMFQNNSLLLILLFFYTTECQLAHSASRFQDGIPEEKGKREEIVIQCASQGLAKSLARVDFLINVDALCKCLIFP